MALNVDPKIDFAFKWLFGRERNVGLLLDLLNAVLEGHSEPITDVEILNPFNDKMSDEDKLSILDLKVRDKRGWQFNVEMQMLPDQHFRKRLLYYWARLHVQQLKESDPYSELRPTVGIAFVNASVFEKREECQSRFAIRESASSLLFSDDFALHILELPKFKKQPDAWTREVDRWLFFLKHAETIAMDELPKALDTPIFRQAMKELAMLAQDPIERERYEARVKMHRDELSRVLSARDQGIAEGLAAGEAKGLAAGEARGLAEAIRAFETLLERQVTPGETLEGLSLDELRLRAHELQAEIARRLRGTRNGQDKAG